MLSRRALALRHCIACQYGVSAARFTKINARNSRTLTPSPSMTMTVTRSMSEDGPKSPAQSFRVLDGAVETTSQEFAENAARSSELSDRYEQLLALATAGGGPKAIERHVKHNKKLLAWDRARLLFDDYSEVLELGTLAGMRMEYGDIPRSGVITAIGKIQGVYCMVSLHDASVKGGTSFPISVKKGLRSQEVALQNWLPYVFVVDSGGAFLPLQADIFPDKEHGGRTFYNEAILNACGIPQLAIVVGSCTAGGAYVPTMVQESVIVHRVGSIFLGGPPLVKAALGEDVTAEDLGGATLHCGVSGYTDHFAIDEQEAFDLGRDIVLSFNIEPNVSNSTPRSFEEPLYSASDLAGIIPRNKMHTMDVYKVLARLVDGSRFHEFKARFGRGLVTGFGYLEGRLVGVIADNGPATEESALKGSHFVQLCDQRQVPLVFLQNTWPDDEHDHTTAFNDTSQQEEAMVRLGGRLRAQAKMMASVACSDVPKITLIIGNSQGSGHYTMCGRSFSPNFMFCWPNACISMTDPKEVVQETLVSQGIAEDREAVAKVREEVALKTSALFSASRNMTDGIVKPEETRHVLSQCVNIVSQGQRLRPRQGEQQQQAVLRM